MPTHLAPDGAFGIKLGIRTTFASPRNPTHNQRLAKEVLTVRLKPSNMIFGDKKYELFTNRMYEALKREKFNRIEPYNETPSNISSAKKFYFTFRSKEIFICLPRLLFESLILEIWYIAQNTNESKLKPEELLKQLYGKANSSHKCNFLV